mmetsp:Transcript_20055/g.45425  ORF Transcript_20055/g.45425 Transcript_20055/m.45425 type:complete len:384 (-) Transcript_20055:517-1668(-)
MPRPSIRTSRLATPTASPHRRGPLTSSTPYPSFHLRQLVPPPRRPRPAAKRGAECAFGRRPRERGQPDSNHQGTGFRQVGGHYRDPPERHQPQTRGRRLAQDVLGHRRGEEGVQHARLACRLCRSKGRGPGGGLRKEDNTPFQPSYLAKLEYQCEFFLQTQWNKEFSMSDPIFDEHGSFKNALNVLVKGWRKEFKASHYGNTPNRAEAIPPALFSKIMHGFNLDDPRDLQDAAHFCVGVGYALRGKKEHEVLTFDQLTWGVDEHGTKLISIDPDFFKNHSSNYIQQVGAQLRALHLPGQPGGPPRPVQHPHPLSRQAPCSLHGPLLHLLARRHRPCLVQPQEAEWEDLRPRLRASRCPCSSRRPWQGGAPWLSPHGAHEHGRC